MTSERVGGISTSISSPTPVARERRHIRVSSWAIFSVDSLWRKKQNVYKSTPKGSEKQVLLFQENMLKCWLRKWSAKRTPAPQERWLLVVCLKILLDANFVINKLAGQLLLPVSQLLKITADNGSRGFRGDLCMCACRITAMNTVLDICRLCHQHSPLQPLRHWKSKWEK